jgi:O-antigen ligase
MIATRAKQANRLLFFTLCAFPLFMPHWISMLSILMLATGLFYVVRTKQFSFNWHFFLPLAGILAPYLIWLLASDHLALGLNSIQVKLMLIALPLTFSFNVLRLTEKDQHIAFSVLSIASIATVLLCNLMMAIKGFTHPVGLDGADLTYSYRVSLEYYSGLHPTYYCAIVYTAAFIQLYRLLKKEIAQRWEYILAIATILICTVGGIAAASRATFVAYLVIAIVFVFLHFKTHPKRWLFLGTLAAGCVLLFFSPMVQNRLQEMTAANMKAPVGNNDNGTNVRSGIFSCDVQLLNENWLLGVGTGDIQAELNTCLSQYNTHVYKAFNYNTHNEYLNIWITAGLFGLLVWLLCLGYPLVQSIRQKYWLHLYFIMFMAICFVTENYLDRQMGVTFFALMQTLFFFKTIPSSEPTSVKQN